MSNEDYDEQQKEELKKFRRIKEEYKMRISRDRELTPLARLIGINISDRSRLEREDAYPGIETIAAEVGCANSTARLAIKELEATEWLSCRRRRGAHNWYTLNWGNRPDLQEVKKPEKNERVENKVSRFTTTSRPIYDGGCADLQTKVRRSVGDEPDSNQTLNLTNNQPSFPSGNDGVRESESPQVPKDKKSLQGGENFKPPVIAAVREAVIQPARIQPSLETLQVRGFTPDVALAQLNEVAQAAA